MPKHSRIVLALLTIASLPLPVVIAGCGADTTFAQEGAPQAQSAASAGGAFVVSGTAVHFLSTAVIHSEQATESGKVQRSTEIIRLDGDLRGYILYHPTSTFDFAAGTLVNVGTQVFSGTVAGSEPVVLHDDRFRFEVDLATGATRGEVYLGRSGDAPDRDGWFDCQLEVVGTGMTPAGDALAEYHGRCTPRGRHVQVR
jgi:hypothetical protein